MVATTLNGLTIEASDLTGQKTVRVRNIPADSTVGDLVRSLVPRMALVGQVDGRPLTYGARLEREGRHLNVAERVSDALLNEDRIVLLPSVDAG
jgi:hypothetical protein